MVIARRLASFGFAVLLSSSAAHAGTFAVFGPRDYTRATGQPQTIRETFTIQHAAVPYKLRIVNGGVAGTFGKVKSAIVKINGVEIFGTKDFNSQAPVTLEKSVTLTATNEISVEVRDAPGDGMTISVLGEDSTPPVITATLTPPPNVAGWNSDIVTVTFACSDAMTGVTSCSAPVTVTAEGITGVTGNATDGAGNTAAQTVSVKIDKTPPALAIAAPAQDTVVAATIVDISGSSSDALAGVESVTCNGELATLNGSSFTCRATMTDGENAISLVASDRAENTILLVLDIRSDTTPPAITIDSPTSGSTNVATLTVSGSVTDGDQVASMRIAGQPVTLAGGAFSETVSLGNGANTIPVEATDRAGNVATKSLQITRYALPTVAITAPADLVIMRDAVITVRGTVTDASSVEVNGINAAVANGMFSASGVPLAQGRTVITAKGTSDSGSVATSTILVYRDSIPPRVVLRYPLDGAIVGQASIDVTGMVDDIVVGTINSEQMSVRVNDVQAEVANRAFVARGIPLTPGLNTIRVVGTDQGGNSVTVTAAVSYDNSAQTKIAVVSGDDQTGLVGAMLDAPIAVKVTNNGIPVSGRTVTFEVVENNGTLTGSNGTDRVVSAATDSTGTASVRWTLGTRAGAGNQRVTAVASGVAGGIQFSASGQTGIPEQVVVDSGDAQYGAVGAQLSRPLVAIVIDAGKNRLAGVPVTFSVLQGTGHFDDQQQVTVTTDSDGRAWATPTIGQASINVFQANVAGVTNGAGFQAFGKVAGAPEQTSISGVILDNTDLPVPGVTVRIEGTTLVAQASNEGQFTIPQAPVGYVKLIVDGSTSLRPGTWPTLEYAMYTISGANNTLEMPIHILPLDVRRGLFVDEITGGTLTLPELPGFSLTVKPGSATFPGGGRTGIVSVTMVHADKVPMSPGFGQQPRFIITIQPPGVHFDPPAPMTFPNVDSLEPGSVTEMYSFDHDLGQFVSIGTASVSSDGMVIGSDPGVGIIKGGWHCGGNPIHNGTTANCPTCYLCLNDHCNNPYMGDEKRSSDPDDMCCEGGVFFNKKTNCCGGPAPLHLVGKRFTGFTDCPGWVIDRAYPSNQVPPIFDYNGCSIPDIPFLTTSNANNPAYGQFTELSGVVQYGKYKGPQNGNYTLPCDAHDECYQRCNPSSKGICESNMFQNIMSVCNYAELSGEDSVTVANCRKWAGKIRDGLQIGGTFAFMSNQKKACLCCADSSNPF